MLLIMGVSLFTVRIVLKTLGAEDYGINNVVGGIVAMLGFFTSTMTSASQRFFAFELGRKNYENLSRYFQLMLLLYVGLGFIVFILSETIGLWFLKTQMVIPVNRMNAAMWVFHLSIVSFIINMFVIPYNSMIIAYEKMNIYAYVSILEAIFKLLIVYLLLIVNSDKLIVYAVLMVVVTLVISLIYISYCTFKFQVCKPAFYWNKKMFVKLINYSGWSLFGALSGMVRNQGINILLNIFFNPIVNAARAIAFQVNNSINLFVTNFYQAVRPQITKQYAAGEHQEMMKLVFRSSKFCYYLILFFAIPLLIETPYVLSIWLTDVPKHTILFTRLVIVTSMIESISYPFMTAISATGKIKWFQIITGGLLILNLPVSYLFLKLGYPPEITMYVAICIALLSQVSRMFFMSSMHKMSITKYLKDILLVILFISVASGFMPFIINKFMDFGFSRFLFVLVTSLFSTVITVYLIGLTVSERRSINFFIKGKFQKSTK